MRFSIKRMLRYVIKLVGCMKESNLVFSGYVLCKHCLIAKMAFQIRGVCSNCKRRNFEYGVLKQGRFMTYNQIKARVSQGQVFIDGTHQGLSITHKTFGLKDATKPKRKHFK